MVKMKKQSMSEDLNIEPIIKNIESIKLTQKIPVKCIWDTKAKGKGYHTSNTQKSVGKVCLRD